MSVWQDQLACGGWAFNIWLCISFSSLDNCFSHAGHDRNINKYHIGQIMQSDCVIFCNEEWVWCKSRTSQMYLAFHRTNERVLLCLSVWVRVRLSYKFEFCFKSRPSYGIRPRNETQYWVGVWNELICYTVSCYTLVICVRFYLKCDTGYGGLIARWMRINDFLTI